MCKNAKICAAISPTKKLSPNTSKQLNMVKSVQSQPLRVLPLKKANGSKLIRILGGHIPKTEMLINLLCINTHRKRFVP